LSPKRGADDERVPRLYEVRISTDPEPLHSEGTPSLRRHHCFDIRPSLEKPLEDLLSKNYGEICIDSDVFQAVPFNKNWITPQGMPGVQFRYKKCRFLETKENCTFEFFLTKKP
jgi:hypothetical protein